MKIRYSNLKYLPAHAYYDEMDSPVGRLTLIATHEGLHALWWENYFKADHYQSVLTHFEKMRQHRILCLAREQLVQYFEGKRQAFDLPLVLQGTSFQKQAWEILQRIPYGQTITYAAQAEKVGHKNKARAVGLANACNPISIVVPCHRVIGSRGDLTGFAGGLDKKSVLLELEKHFFK
jgi:methylated-DNA-[protein]-cysteine S-methyltransferase